MQSIHGLEVEPFPSIAVVGAEVANRGSTASSISLSSHSMIVVPHIFNRYRRACDGDSIILTDFHLISALSWAISASSSMATMLRNLQPKPPVAAAVEDFEALLPWNCTPQIPR